MPKQDLFAALVWAVGDPDDGRSAERVAELYREFQARRLARAAERARAR